MPLYREEIFHPSLSIKTRGERQATEDRIKKSYYWQHRDKNVRKAATMRERETGAGLFSSQFLDT